MIDETVSDRRLEDRATRWLLKSVFLYLVRWHTCSTTSHWHWIT